MKLYFITGNKNKLQEVQSILKDFEIEQYEIDLPEPQEIDARHIIKIKLQEALKHEHAGFIVEDTSLHFDCLKGLPGPLIKWFLKTIGNEGLAEIAEKLGNDRAEAVTIVGYAGDSEMHFFEGSIKGRIVKPRGSTVFGWDPIFTPDGFQVSFAELSRADKNKISMRKKALDKLGDFLKKR